MPVNPPLNRKLRMGLVGSGGGFIGRIHALAAMLDNRAVLAAGVLSSDPAKARTLAPDFDLPPERAYGSYQEMVAAEARLPPDEHLDFVSIATPNHTHFAIASPADRTPNALATGVGTPRDESLYLLRQERACEPSQPSATFPGMN